MATDIPKRKAPYKIHLAVAEDRPGGGYWTGTLCGNASGKAEDGTNAECKEADVTCLKCKAIMADPNHWAHRRFITPKPLSL